MPRYTCPHCGANNSDAGQCVICLKSIGSRSEALRAGLYSAVILAFLWAGATAVFMIQLPVLAVGYGAVVALCVSHFSGGKGFFYQAIATGFTIMGIVFAESMSAIVITWREGGIAMNQVTLGLMWQDMVYRATENAATILYYVLGIIGSFCIWR